MNYVYVLTISVMYDVSVSVWWYEESAIKYAEELKAEDSDIQYIVTRAEDKL